MTTTNKRQKTLTWNSVPKQGVLIINGHRGEGKSALGWWLAQTMYKRTGKRVAALGVPDTAQKLLPKRGMGSITFVEDVAEIAALPPSIVVCDEASFQANSREAMSDTNKSWLKLIAICRLKDHLLIFIHQQSRQLDIQIMMDADLVLMKKPTKLHIREARPSFKPEMEIAAEEFENTRGDTRKRVFMVNYHNGIHKMLPAYMPSWWTDKISKAYAEVAIG